MAIKSEKKFEKSILKFQFIVYFLSCCLLFILLYIVPIIIDFKINGYTSLLDQKDSLRSFAETPSEAIDYLLKNWLVYINPFSKGRIFDSNEIEGYLKSLNLPLKTNYIEPCSNTDILKRMLKNLSYSYNKVGESTKVSEIKELQLIL